MPGLILSVNCASEYAWPCEGAGSKYVRIRLFKSNGLSSSRLRGQRDRLGRVFVWCKTGHALWVTLVADNIRLT